MVQPEWVRTNAFVGDCHTLISGTCTSHCKEDLTRDFESKLQALRLRYAFDLFTSEKTVFFFLYL